MCTSNLLRDLFYLLKIGQRAADGASGAAITISPQDKAGRGILQVSEGVIKKFCNATCL
jgi:hypothetical protein